MVRLEGKEYDIKGRTNCQCGHKFTLKDMKELQRINQPGFYGNIVKHYSRTKCPACKKETILFLKQAGQTWEILDIATENIKEGKNNMSIKSNKTENAVKEHVSKIEQKNTNSNEIICPVCGKACKSQIGYNSHMKTHQNN